LISCVGRAGVVSAIAIRFVSFVWFGSTALTRAMGPTNNEERPADRRCYLPREVFFGRLSLVGVFFSVRASDFGRFFPATSGSFPVSLIGAP
jgi:hypothetical protein